MSVFLDIRYVEKSYISQISKILKAHPPTF